VAGGGGVNYKFPLTPFEFADVGGCFNRASAVAGIVPSGNKASVSLLFFRGRDANFAGSHNRMTMGQVKVMSNGQSSLVSGRLQLTTHYLFPNYLFPK
jgi:hypothetical protein